MAGVNEPKRSDRKKPRGSLGRSLRYAYACHGRSFHCRQSRYFTSKRKPNTNPFFDPVAKKMNFKLRIQVLSGLILLLVLPGCRQAVDEEGRKNISGVITLDGQPVSEGNIRIVPVETQKRSGASLVGADKSFTDGKYSLLRDAGLFAGTYKVFISSSKYVDAKTGEDATDVQYTADPDKYKSLELIPQKYNKKSELTITVGEDKNQTFDFNLEASAKK